MPPCKDARRLVADPKNEPNFYRISRQYPLDGSAPVSEATEDLPQAKRLRGHSVAVPQGFALGTNMLAGAPMGFVPNQAGIAGLGAPSPGAMLLMPHPQQQQLNTGVSNQAAALLSILEALNQQQQKEKEKQQHAVLAAALMQQQQQSVAQDFSSAGNNNNNNALAAVLGMLGQR